MAVASPRVVSLHSAEDRMGRVVVATLRTKPDEKRQDSSSVVDQPTLAGCSIPVGVLSSFPTPAGV